MTDNPSPLNSLRPSQHLRTHPPCINPPKLEIPLLYKITNNGGFLSMENTDTNDRIILVTGDSKKWFEQAIFIVRKDFPKDNMPKDFISEAEQIINGYLSGKKSISTATSYKQRPPAYGGLSPVSYAPNTTNQKKPKRKRGFDLGLNLVMLACCVVLAFLLFRL